MRPPATRGRRSSERPAREPYLGVKRARIQRVAASAGTVLLAIVLLGTMGWGVLALYFFDDASAPARTALAAVFAALALLCLAAYTQAAWRRQALVVYAVLFGALLIAVGGIRPSNERDWLPEMARLPYATIDGDLVTVHDIRNFDYRTETDFTPAYYDRTFDVRELTGVDLIASYWMGPSIAHLFVSFEFNRTDHVAISIEARRARGQAYSSLQGFFRRFELIYVVADERDLIRLRTNIRRDPPEEVYVYRLRGPPANGQRLFLEYMKRIDQLRVRPEFYNSLTSNCANGIWMLARIDPDHVPWSWKILLSGYAPEYLYEQGRLDTSIPFGQLQRESHVNARGHAADDAPDFSQKIRAPLPPATARAAPASPSPWR